MGTPLAVYAKEGAVGYTLEERMGSVLRPLAGMCGMELQPFVSTGSVSYADRNDKEAAQGMHKRSLEHAGKVTELIKQNEK